LQLYPGIFEPALSSDDVSSLGLIKRLLKATCQPALAFGLA
jgi:hypothetical protein